MYRVLEIDLNFWGIAKRSIIIQIIYKKQFTRTLFCHQYKLTENIE